MPNQLGRDRMVTSARPHELSTGLVETSKEAFDRTANKTRFLTTALLHAPHLDYETYVFPTSRLKGQRKLDFAQLMLYALLVQNLKFALFLLRLGSGDLRSSYRVHAVGDVLLKNLAFLQPAAVQFAATEIFGVFPEPDRDTPQLIEACIAQYQENPALMPATQRLHRLSYTLGGEPTSVRRQVFANPTLLKKFEDEPTLKIIREIRSYLSTNLPETTVTR